MDQFAFIFSVAPNAIEIDEIEVPDEYRVAWGFFEDQRPELYLDEIRAVFDFLVGRSDDLDVAIEALLKSQVYDQTTVDTYLPNRGISVYSLAELRSAIMSYATETFTSQMLQQDNPYAG